MKLLFFDNSSSMHANKIKFWKLKLELFHKVGLKENFVKANIDLFSSQNRPLTLFSEKNHTFL